MAWHYALPLLTKVYQNRSIDQIFGKKEAFWGEILSHDVERIRTATLQALQKPRR